jgi:hypothetical protein
MLVAISLEHQRDHDDGPAEPREGCNGCKLIEFAWQQYEAAQAAREVATALEALAASPVEFSDERISYVAVQIDRADLDAARAALARFWAQVER